VWPDPDVDLWSWKALPLAKVQKRQLEVAARAVAAGFVPNWQAEDICLADRST